MSEQQQTVMGVRDRLRAKYGKTVDLLAPYVPAEPAPELPVSAKPKRKPRVLITQPTDAPESDIRMCRDCGAHIEKGRKKCDSCVEQAKRNREIRHNARKVAAKQATRGDDIRLCPECETVFIGQTSAVCCSDACRRKRKTRLTREREVERAAGPSAMPCPHCGARTEIDRTWTLDESGAQMRRRMCMCGFRGRTVERWEDAA